MAQEIDSRDLFIASLSDEQLDDIDAHGIVWISKEQNDLLTDGWNKPNTFPYGTYICKEADDSYVVSHILPGGDTFETYQSEAAALLDARGICDIEDLDALDGTQYAQEALEGNLSVLDALAFAYKEKYEAATQKVYNLKQQQNNFSTTKDGRLILDAYDDDVVLVVDKTPSGNSYSVIYDYDPITREGVQERQCETLVEAAMYASQDVILDQSIIVAYSDYKEALQGAMAARLVELGLVSLDYESIFTEAFDEVKKQIEVPDAIIEEVIDIAEYGKLTVEEAAIEAITHASENPVISDFVDSTLSEYVTILRNDMKQAKSPNLINDAVKAAQNAAKQSGMPNKQQDLNRPSNFSR